MADRGRGVSLCPPSPMDQTGYMLPWKMVPVLMEGACHREGWFLAPKGICGELRWVPEVGCAQAVGGVA